MIKKYLRTIYHSNFINTSKSFIPLHVTKFLIKLLDLISPFRFSLVRSILLRFSGVRLGKGTKICGGGFVSSYSSLIIGHNVWISKDKQIQVRAGCYFIVGDNTEIGPELMVLSDTHKVGSFNKRAGIGIHQSIKIGNGCWLGASVTLLPGTIIGNGCIVAAGSVVYGNIPDNVMIAGVPAKIKKELSKENES